MEILENLNKRNLLKSCLQSAFSIDLALFVAIFMMGKIKMLYIMMGWSGVAKVLCILRHLGVQLILAYS